MNGELEVVKTNAVIFSLKRHEQEVSEVKSIKIEETIVAQEVRTIEPQERFSRLKKSLSKRSRSIL